MVNVEYYDKENNETEKMRITKLAVYGFINSACTGGGQITVLSDKDSYTHIVDCDKCRIELHCTRRVYWAVWEDIFFFNGATCY